MMITERPPLSTNPVAANGMFAEVEALFKEAKRRERLRRTVALAGLIALVGGGLGLAFGLRGSGGGKSLPLTAPRFSSAAIAATTAARTATLSFVYGSPAESECRYWSVTSGSGVISFATSSLSYTKTVSGCQKPTQQTQWRAVGTSVYETFPQSIRGVPTSTAKPWLAVSRHTYLSRLIGDELNDSMISTTPFQILRALTGSLTLLGDASIGGVATTEYVGSATLASFHANGFPGLTAARVSAIENRTRSALLPVANTVAITIHVWIDAQGRVVQLNAFEPVYTGVFVAGSSQEGVTQIPSTPPQGGLQLLRRPITEVITVDFSNFGSRVVVPAPPMSKVTAYNPQQLGMR